MSSPSALLRQNEEDMGVNAGVSSIAPANETNLGITAAAVNLPRGDSVVAERVATTGQSLSSFADIEGAQMNKGDVGFFGSQVAKTIGEATGALFDFFRDKSPDNDNETVEPEAKVAAPAMPQFTASPGFGSGPG